VPATQSNLDTPELEKGDEVLQFLFVWYWEVRASPIAVYLSGIEGHGFDIAILSQQNPVIAQTDYSFPSMPNRTEDPGCRLIFVMGKIPIKNIRVLQGHLGNHWIKAIRVHPFKFEIVGEVKATPKGTAFIALIDIKALEFRI